MPQFYSESWALAHMLLLGPKYRTGFPALLKLLRDGKDTEWAFERVYGKSMGQIQGDLRAYFMQGSITVNVFPTHGVATSEIAAQIPPPFEMEMVLADLLSIHDQTAPEADMFLTKFAAESTKNPEVEASLGYVKWQEHRIPEAEAHFETAMQDDSRDAVMMFHYAGLLYRTGGAPGQIIRTLQRAVDVQPSYTEARYSLGMEAVNQGECELAIRNLSKLSAIRTDRAFPLYSAMAYCEAKLGDFPEARRLTQLAQQYARDPKERGKAGEFLQQIHRAEESKSLTAR